MPRPLPVKSWQGRAINVVVLATALEIGARNRKRKNFRIFTVELARLKQIVKMQVAARDCARNRLANADAHHRKKSKRSYGL